MNASPVSSTARSYVKVSPVVGLHNGNLLSLGKLKTQHRLGKTDIVNNETDGCVSLLVKV